MAGGEVWVDFRVEVFSGCVCAFPAEAVAEQYVSAVAVAVDSMMNMSMLLFITDNGRFAPGMLVPFLCWK